MSDSPGLVDFAIGLLIFVLNLPDGQVLFLGKFTLQKDCISILLIQKGVLGLVEMTCGLTHASYSLPEWQAAKLTRTLSHKTPICPLSLPPLHQILHKCCLQFLWGGLQYLGEFKNKRYAKFWGQTRCNHDWKCANGDWNFLEIYVQARNKSRILVDVSL